MLRLSIAFLAGGITVAAAAFLFVSQLALAMFGAGSLFTIVVFAGALCSAKRARQAARILTSVAEGLDAFHGTARRAKAPAPAALVDEAHADLTAALVQMGAKKSAAAVAAKAAIERIPAGSFTDRFRTAVQLIPKNA